MSEVQFVGLKGGRIALSTDILTALRPQPAATYVWRTTLVTRPSAPDFLTRWSIMSGRYRRRNAKSSSANSAARAAAVALRRPPIHTATPIS
jgi:hypothetical protein